MSSEGKLNQISDFCVVKFLENPPHTVVDCGCCQALYLLCSVLAI